ncbi:InlB B-repeat-containing protein, partial [bacterium]|nr:InlB B-repeat-containing protein [bacterium]
PVTQSLNIYAIRYHTNGGDLNSPITHFDGSESVKLESPTHQDNYRFDGWYEMPDFSGEPLRRIAFGTTRD